MGNIQISLMAESDIHEAAKALSVAMLNNPIHMAVFQGKGEKERIEIEKMFYDLLRELPGIVFLAKEEQNIIGVMRMKLCQGIRAVDSPQDSKDENDIGWRKSIWHREWARHEPLSQHWHLGPIGVLPSHQGLGIGSTLMECFCQKVDACQAEAFLETDLAKNVRFYERFGFKVVSESEIFNVRSRYMLRASRAKE